MSLVNKHRVSERSGSMYSREGIVARGSERSQRKFKIVIPIRERSSIAESNEDIISDYAP